MRKLFNFFHRKRNAEPKLKTITFNVSEAVCSGDWYEYKIDANSQAEAFAKLVEFFFGEHSNQPVEMRSGYVSYPAFYRFTFEGMPYWFAQLISGCPDRHGDKHRKELEIYAIKNDIKLKPIN